MNRKINDKRKTIRKHTSKKPPVRKLTEITHIAIHHSLTTSGSAEAFASYHVGNLGWSVMSYTYVVNKDGSIDWCADYTVVTPHVGKHNRYSLGICLVGDFRTQKPTKEQYEALLWLIDYVQKNLPNKCKIFGHSEYSGYGWKACPVINMDELREDVANMHQESKPQQGGNKPMELSQVFWNIIETTLQEQYDKGILSSDQWIIKARNRQLTNDEATMLLFAILGRNLERLEK